MTNGASLRRTRLAIVLAFLVALTLIPSALAHAWAAPLTLAQVGEEEEGEGQEEQNPEGPGQDNPEAETGAGQGETEGGQTEAETGPPWTYQMVWMSLALTVLLALAIGWLYYRLVVTRRRGEV